MAIADCALSVSKATLDRELHILLIFMVMILVVLFGHSLIRFCMVALRRPRPSVAENRIPSREGPVGYAQLEHPIPVIVPGDEESLIGEKPAAPPPAYGLWRSSVVSANSSAFLIKYHSEAHLRGQPPEKYALLTCIIPENKP